MRTHQVDDALIRERRESATASASACTGRTGMSRCCRKQADRQVVWVASRGTRSRARWPCWMLPPASGCAEHLGSTHAVRMLRRGAASYRRCGRGAAPEPVLEGLGCGRGDPASLWCRWRCPTGRRLGRDTLPPDVPHPLRRACPANLSTPASTADVLRVLLWFPTYLRILRRFSRCQTEHSGVQRKI